jgi:MotA/TolQ/ExbB proton channel family protein
LRIRARPPRVHSSEVRETTSDQRPERVRPDGARAVALTPVAGGKSAAAEASFARPLFVRWLCIATASGLVLSALVLGGFARGVSGAPLAVALVIVAATVAIAGLAGALHWRADRVLGSGGDEELERLRHDAQLVYYAVALFQVLGMIGALLGYRQQTSSAAVPDSQAAVHALTLGLGNGLTATLAGVVCSVIVWVMFLHLQHALDRPR